MIRVRLPVPPDFHFDAIVRSHGWYDLPPFAYERENGVLRTVVAHEGDPAPVAFRMLAGTLQAESTTLPRARLALVAKRVFSLDVQVDGFAETIVGEPRLARALARGGGRMLRAPTLFEDAAKMLLTTNCSWAATKGMVTRLIAEAGAGSSAFPVPEAVAKLRASTLKSRIRCGYRAEALARLGRRFGSGRLDPAAWEEPHRAPEDIRGAILAEHGFGPYAAEGLLRILGRHDFLAIDSWIRQKYRRLYPGRMKSTDRAIARRYARFGPYRGLVLWLDMTSDWHEGGE